MPPSRVSVSHFARSLRLVGIALLLSCVADAGIVPAAEAKTVGKPTAAAGRQTKRAIVRDRRSAARKKLAAKKNAPARQNGTTSTPTSTAPASTAPTASPGPSGDPSTPTSPTSTAPWMPIAGGGSEIGGTGTPPTPSAPEIVSTPTPAETTPVTASGETAPVTAPTETPPTTSPTKSVPAGRIFTGAKISDFALNQSAPGAVTEVASPTGGGETSLQMTVANSDVYPVTPTDNPRAQLLSPDLFNPGDEFWWHSKFFLPANLPSVPGWMAVMEGPYGAPFDGSPPFSIELHGETMGWQRNSTYGYDIPWETSIVRNKWVEVLVHCRFGTDGFVELWINGEQITFFSHSPYNPRHEKATTQLNMATEDASNNGGTNFAVIQSYRQAGILNSASLFQGPMLIGSTRASVE